jgi:hypothetical protein
MSKPVNMACLVLAFLFLKNSNAAADTDMISSLSHQTLHRKMYMLSKGLLALFDLKLPILRPEQKHDCCRFFKACVAYRNHLHNISMLWNGGLALVCSTPAKVTNEQLMISVPSLEAQVFHQNLSVDIV